METKNKKNINRVYSTEKYEINVELRSIKKKKKNYIIIIGDLLYRKKRII